jgi:hypothetical protein
MQQQVQPRSLIGTWRRFGPAGPAYEVIAIGDELDFTLNRLVDDLILAEEAY